MVFVAQVVVPRIDHVGETADARRRALADRLRAAARRAQRRERPLPVHRGELAAHRSVAGELQPDVVEFHVVRHEVALPAGIERHGRIDEEAVDLRSAGGPESLDRGPAIGLDHGGPQVDLAPVVREIGPAEPQRRIRIVGMCDQRIRRLRNRNARHPCQRDTTSHDPGSEMHDSFSLHRVATAGRSTFGACNGPRSAVIRKPVNWQNVATWRLNARGSKRSMRAENAQYAPRSP